MPVGVFIAEEKHEVCSMSEKVYDLPNQKRVTETL